MRWTPTTKPLASVAHLTLRPRKRFPIIRWISLFPLARKGCGPVFDRLPKLKLAQEAAR
jgi:hypothetical protein